MGTDRGAAAFAPGQAAPLRGHRVNLRPIVPRDYESLYLVEVSSALGPRWRHQGATPSFERFTQLLWQGVLAQFIVTDPGGRTAFGYVTAYEPNFRDGYVSVAVAKFDQSDTSGRVLEGLAIFVNYLFDAWPLRKLYAESAEGAYVSFRSGAGRLFEEIGTMPGRDWRAGMWTDVHLLECDRERWNRWAPVILPRVLSGARFRQPGGRFIPSREWADHLEGE